MVIECAAAKLLCDREILERESAKFADSLSGKVLVINYLAAAGRDVLLDAQPRPARSATIYLLPV